MENKSACKRLFGDNFNTGLKDKSSAKMSQADFERAWMHGNFIYNPRFYYIREKSM
ncbi:MAG: hypothetical protein P4L45_08195 [Ignavibacteriaceae bacterium]|jgi:hypothetical protein|nr:hypothetical protein [Ignavibacteriaceae bacterium]